MTPEQFERLPKYARQHIRDLERDKERAVRALETFLDEQTPSNCWVEDYGVGRRFVQGDRVVINYQGVELSVTFRGDRDGMFLSWGAEACDGVGDVALVPTGRQQARIKNPAHHEDNLRRLFRAKKRIAKQREVDAAKE